MKSIGRNIRNNWSGERRTPNPEQQNIGFYTGIVMDDQDDQRMGRLWIYIPTISSTRFDENSTPNYGGTTPDRQSGRIAFDEKLRLGWILCYPMFPFFGGDDYRVNNGPDGRDSKKGDTNTYGMWYQPRNGDNVGVLFANGDPSNAYWIGNIPKQSRNFMVPGSAGVPKNDLDDPADGFSQTDASRDTSPNPIKSIVPDTALVPVMDRASTRDNPTRDGKFPSTTFGRNLIGAGLISDPARGAGTSTARRESPSYVMGLKSSGWSYESEKFNKDVDGAQFQDRQSELRTHNAMGHQFVMDDHPDYQSVRIRSSYGSQIYMNDACVNPYIYINTPRGNVWLEFNDSGDINVYNAGSLNWHAGKDVNFTADRNVNFEVFGDMNMLVHGEQRMEVQKDTNWAFGSNGNAPRNVIDYGDNSHTVRGTKTNTTDGDRDDTILGNLSRRVGGDYGETVGGSTVSNAGGDRYEQAGGLYANESTNIFLNSGLTSTPLAPEAAILPRFPIPTEKFGPPTPEQIISGEPPAKRPYLASVVPQHQPWPLRCGAGNTFGTNGYVGARPTSIPGTVPPPSQNTSCARTEASLNYRRGAPDSRASAPISFAGNRAGQDEPGIYVGRPYNGTSRGEAPQWKLARALRVGETVAPDSLSVSEAAVDFIKQQDVFQAVPKLDLNGVLTIGFGHRISVGDILGGIEITDELFSKMTKTSGTFEGVISIDQDEASSLLTNEIEDVAEFIRSQMPNRELTQDQFDSLVGSVRNIGMDTVKNTTEGKAFLNGVKDGRFEEISENLMPFVHLDGFVSCDMVDRRRAEIEQQYATIPDQDDIVTQAVNYTPSGVPLEVGDWSIDPDVADAINQAADTHGVPREFMYAMAAQESGFNPNAQSSTSSAKGLYQFIDSTAADYGLTDPLNPTENADAAARFFNDNKIALKNGALNGSDPSNTDLYLAHFLGAGSQSLGNGANGFIDQLNSNPSASPANNPKFAAAAKANPNVFFDKNGNGKSYQQVYDYFDSRMTRRVALFQPVIA